MEMKDKPALAVFRDQTTPTASLAAKDEPFLLLTRAGTTEHVQLDRHQGDRGSLGPP